MRKSLLISAAAIVTLTSSAFAAAPGKAPREGVIYGTLDTVGEVIAGWFDATGAGLSATAGVVNGAATSMGIGPNQPAAVVVASDNDVIVSKGRRRR